MAQYLLIESRDPYENRGVERDLELAAGLAAEGNQVTLFLIQNGVFPARGNANHDSLRGVRGKGIEILADEFSLRERGIDKGDLTDGIRPASLEVVVDKLAAGARTLWL